MELAPGIQNIAYIDETNLYNGIKEDGWKLDYARFRVFLIEKYNAKIAKVFMGKVLGYENIYRKLEQAGYVLVFKEITRDSAGKIKGNCDAELILDAVSDFYEKRLSQAILVTSDGDFACLAKFFKEKGTPASIISPRASCSFLLRKIGLPILYMTGKKSLRAILEFFPIKPKDLIIGK